MHSNTEYLIQGLQMPAARASYSIDPEVLQRFNELVPASKRSQTIQALMESVLNQKKSELEALALEFETHPDFAQARADIEIWDCVSADGLGPEVSK
jgi:hypothetical protein